MTKQEVLDKLSDARRDWLALLTSIPTQRREEPGVHGAWSVKDVLAHTTWHEREMEGVFRQRRLVGSPWWDLPRDERNALIYEENRHRSWEEIWDDAQTVYEAMRRALSKATDEEFNDSSKFAEMPAEWTPHELLAGNTWDHYREHGAAIGRWLARR